MAKIIEMNGKAVKDEASETQKKLVMEALGRQQLQWVQYFEVLIKGLAHDPNCQYCKGPDGVGRGYVAINYVTPPPGKGIAQGYYQLQFCRCAAIPQGMDPNMMYQFMQQLEYTMNEMSRYIFRHTFYGLWVYLGVSAWRWIVDKAIQFLEWLGRITEPKKKAGGALPDEQQAEAPEFTGGAGEVPQVDGANDQTMPPGEKV